MKLSDWIKKNNLSYSQAANAFGIININPATNVQRYAKGERIPHPKVMFKIFKATKKEVQPNNFYEDIVSNSEWMTLEKAKDQSYSWCEDTGYLLHKDQKKVIIFASHSFDDDGSLTVGNTTVYPRSVVKKIEVLK